MPKRSISHEVSQLDEIGLIRLPRYGVINNESGRPLQRSCSEGAASHPRAARLTCQRTDECRVTFIVNQQQRHLALR